MKAELFEVIGKRVGGDGFALKAAKDWFVRKRGGVTDHFSLVCLDGKPGFRIQPNVGVRIDRVEKIFH